MKIIRLLIIEDSDDDLFILVRTLKIMEYEPVYERILNEVQMRNALKSAIWDLIIADYVLPDFNASAALKILQEKNMDIPFIIVSGTISEEIAVNALKSGASDFMSKNNLSRLGPAIERELREVKVRNDKKKADEELKSNYEKLKELNKLKSNCLSIISHEIRTPLTIIRGYLSFLLKGMAGQLNPQQREFIDIVDSNSKRINAIIEDLIDVSKIEAGIIHIEKSRGDIVQLLKSAIKDMGYIASNKHINLIDEINLDKMELDIDKNRIQQVFVNLINNAIKFSLPNTSVKIGAVLELVNKTTPVLTFKHIKENTSVVKIYFQDEGFGIKENNLEKIFENFYQVEDANNRKHEGIGIGLSIVKKIIDAHGGLVWAESAGLNQGSVFKIILPVS